MAQIGGGFRAGRKPAQDAKPVASNCKDLAATSQLGSAKRGTPRENGSRGTEREEKRSGERRDRGRMRDREGRKGGKEATEAVFDERQRKTG